MTYSEEPLKNIRHMLWDFGLVPRCTKMSITPPFLDTTLPMWLGRACFVRGREWRQGWRLGREVMFLFLLAISANGLGPGALGFISRDICKNPNPFQNMSKWIISPFVYWVKIKNLWVATTQIIFYPVYSKYFLYPRSSLGFPLNISFKYPFF